MTNPLLPVAAALAAGILLALGSPGYLFASRLECLLAATAAAFVAIVALGLRRNRLSAMAALVAIVFTGAFYLRQDREVLPPTLLENLVDTAQADVEEPMRLTGSVSLPPEPRDNAEAFEMTLEQVESNRRTLRASGKVRLYHYIRGDEGPVNLQYGERLNVLVRLRRVRGYWNDGDFDREARGRREGVQFQGTVKADELVERLPGRGGYRAMGALLHLRHTLLERLDRLYPQEGPPDPTNAILRAMLLGDRSGLDRRTSEDFEKTGTFHALVIAGLHTAALGGFVLLILRLARVPPLVATPLAIVAITCFTIISGMRVPVVRAALMFSIYLIARLIYRQRPLLNAAAAAALILLVLRPQDLADAGFQMSFFAVILIGAISLPLIEMTSRPYRRALVALDNTDLDEDFPAGPRMMRERLRALSSRAPEEHERSVRDHILRVVTTRAPTMVRVLLHVYELAVTGAVIQLGFTLPMAEYFFRSGGVAIAANLMMVPLIGLVVPLGVVTLAVSLVSPALAALPAVPLAWGVALMMWVARWHSGFSLAVRRVPVPPTWIALAFLAALFLLAVMFARRSAIGVAIAAIPVLVAAWLIATDPFAARIPHDRLQVTALDVGQGDSILVIAPAEKGSGQGPRTLLIDGGGLRDPDFGTDTGADAVAPYLWSLGIRRLDVIAMTHAHQDHIGGLFAILKNFDAGEIWIGPNPESETLKEWETLAAFRGVPVRVHHRGEQIAFGKTKLDFLSPAEDYRPAKRPGNNDSLVIRVSYGSQSALLSGDIERKMENELVREDVPLGATFLKVPHHGSKTSSTEAFLERVHAAFGVISVAVHSPFGHPHDEALGRLQGANVHLLRTDRDGAVTWSTDGRRVEIDTFARHARPGAEWGW